MENYCGSYSNMYLCLSPNTELFVCTGKQQKLQISLQMMNNSGLCKASFASPATETCI